MIVPRRKYFQVACMCALLQSTQQIHVFYYVCKPQILFDTIMVVLKLQIIISYLCFH